MSQSQSQAQSEAQQNEDDQSTTPPDSTRDDWSDVTDPTERRKRQNRLAQRRYRKRVQEQKEESTRDTENQQRAASAYTAVEPTQLESGKELSGLPWGGLSMKHIVESGRTKEQTSQQSSRENSVFAAASRAGGSSRVGLRLTDKFAWGYPAWKAFPFGHPRWGYH